MHQQLNFLLEIIQFLTEHFFIKLLARKKTSVMLCLYNDNPLFICLLFFTVTIIQTLNISSSLKKEKIKK